MIPQLPLGAFARTYSSNTLNQNCLKFVLRTPVARVVTRPVALVGVFWYLVSEPIIVSEGENHE